jgi:peroxiredoxin Q/BCP
MRFPIALAIMLLMALQPAAADRPRRPGAISPAALEPGDAAPPFALKASNGRTYRLADFRGKQAVVVAWFARPFSGGWTAECKSLRESGDAIRVFDVEYFAASVDTIENNRKFAEALGIDFPILSDPTREAALAYGVVRDAQSFAARVTFYIGVDGKILFIDKAVSPSNAGEEVVRRLTQLGVARRGARK